VALLAATGDPRPAAMPSLQGSGSSDATALVLDSPGSRAPAVVRDDTKPDDRISRVVRPVLATAITLAIAFVLTVWWRTRHPLVSTSGSVLSRCAAPRGPPLLAN
jgi:hypothetical protein